MSSPRAAATPRLTAAAAPQSALLPDQPNAWVVRGNAGSAVVVRAVVDDDDFEVRVALGEYGVERPLPREAPRL